MKKMQKDLEVRETLPIHPCDRKDVQPHVLRVDGLVVRPLELTLADLEALPQQKLTDDFVCLEGWKAPAVEWQGVALESVLALAGVNPEAKWVQASAAEFSVPMPLKEVGRALLAISLGEGTLLTVHGGPVRLVVPGGDCFTSIKWLDHLELRARARRKHRQDDCAGALDTIARSTNATPFSPGIQAGLNSLPSTVLRHGGSPQGRLRAAGLEWTSEFETVS